MRLYHGSNVKISQIDFTKCHPFKDFGRGFYLTDNSKHAWDMASRRCMRNGGTESVTEYEFDLERATQNLKVKFFDGPSEEWAEFVMLNRNENVTHPVHDFDIVIGPIADDSVAVSFRLYRNGFISISELIKRLEYKELSTQYFFHNAEAANYLTVFYDK